MVARVRLLMIISGLTTLIAIAAVVGVIGYRAFRAGSGIATATTEGIITLPKGARVIASSLADDRLAVTLDIGGSTEIRTYDLKTLKETGGSGSPPRRERLARLRHSRFIRVGVWWEHDLFGKPASTLGSSPRAGFFRIMLEAPFV